METKLDRLNKRPLDNPHRLTKWLKHLRIEQIEKLTGVGKTTIRRALKGELLTESTLAKLESFLDLGIPKKAPLSRCCRCGKEIAGVREDFLKRRCPTCKSLREPKTKQTIEEKNAFSLYSLTPSPVSQPQSKPTPLECPTCGGPLGISEGFFYCIKNRCEAALAKVRKKPRGV